jgi:hypothetical protein
MAVPFLMPIEGLRLLCRFRDRNPFKRNLPIAGKRRGAFQMDFEVTLAEMKDFTKEKKLTLNDLFVSVLSNSCYEYFQKYKDEGPDKAMVESLKCGFPFSLRAKVDGISEFKTCNDICLFMQQLRLFENFE